MPQMKENLEIDRAKLLKYVRLSGNLAKGGIVFQPLDGLIEVTNKGETSEIENSISQSKIKIIDRAEAEHICPDLASWATKSDILIHLSEGYVLCIPLIDVKSLLIQTS